MEYRQLGKTGLTVSTVGFGGWAIGGDAWGPVEDADSLAAIAQALDLGVTLFDTADVYGRGRSEELLGRALRGRRDEVVISTKVGLWDSHMDVKPNIYSDPELIYERCDESLRRLGTDYVDVYLCHLWWDENTDAFLEAFAELERRGKVRTYGVSTDNAAHLRHFDRDGTCAVVQFDYSILNRAAEAELLPYAAAHEIGTIVRGPLRMGLLTGKFEAGTTFAEDDIRHPWPSEPWFAEALATVEGLRGVAGEGGDLAELAVGFVLSNPAVDAAIPGAKTAAQMAANAAAGARSLAAAELRRIDELAPA
jgi:aryl-alcohol dehydrogenase-like predicted oxidoreductase